MLLWKSTAFFAAIVLCESMSCAAVPHVDYVADLVDRITSESQDMRELGLDVAAHGVGEVGEPLVIGGKTYRRGLGHQAAGEIAIDLNADYKVFDAEVGIQTQKAQQGCAIFQVLVDGRKAFDSGVMRHGDSAKPVHISVDGARELRLVVKKADSGLLYNLADWAEARLTSYGNPKPLKGLGSVDVAEFARVVTWDPKRMDGCRADRVHEFLADDVFLEKDVAAGSDGTYTVPVSDGLGCIGLQWLNRRNLRETGVEFTAGSPLPAPESVRVEYWFGESAWQGAWKEFEGKIKRRGRRLTVEVSDGMVFSQKVRWVFPASAERTVVRSLTARTRSRFSDVDLLIQTEGPTAGNTGEISLYNGQIRKGLQQPWDMSKPVRVRVRHSLPAMYDPDSTVLRFKLPGAAFGVAVDDVIKHGCVYVKDHSLFVAIDRAGTSLADYKRQIAGKKTILEQVRDLPDQTLDRAMAKTHNPIQRNGPVVLSLSCDNAKFLIERDGSVAFDSSPERDGGKFRVHGAIRPRFGPEGISDIERHLEGGWLPIPVMEVGNKGITYTERAFVAPYDDDGSAPARLNRRSVCVIEILVSNPGSEADDAVMSLEFLADKTNRKAAQLTRTGRGYLMEDRGRPLALLDTQACGNLDVQAGDGSVRIAGGLAPGGVAKLVMYIPGVSVAPSEVESLTGADALRARVEAYWDAVMASAARIETPDEFLNNIILSAQVRCLIDSRNEDNGARIVPWIAAMEYGPLESEANSIIRGMDFLGHSEFARKCHDFFISKYNPEGYLTTGYTMFGTAWHLWTVGEHYQLTSDSDWMKRVAPEVTRVCNWAVRQTQKTKGLDAYGHKMPEYGLMPPGVLADWRSFAYHFCMNAYYYAGLAAVGKALEDISDPNGGLFRERAAELRSNTLRAYAWTQSRTPVLELGNGTWVPAYVSQVHSPGPLPGFFPGQDGGRTGAYDVELGAQQLVPAGVLDPGSKDVTRMMDHLEDVQFLTSGWFDYPEDKNRADWFDMGGFSKVQPYYTRNCEIYAMRDDVKPFIRSYFNTIATLLNPETLTLWEHFHNAGEPDKTHETGYFLQQSRFMMAMEHEDELHLAPFATNNWLKDGMSIAATNVPTLFGKTSFRISSHVSAGYIEATIDPPTRRSPKALVIRLRHPEGRRIRSVTTDGESSASFDSAKETVTIAPGHERIVVRAQY